MTMALTPVTGILLVDRHRFTQAVHDESHGLSDANGAADLMG
jgi:hypothetical protein